MNIRTFYQDITLSNDQTLALQKLENFVANDTQVFILKGYAGSGKTTLLKGLIAYLDDTNHQFKVMAPTGRAAHILRKKTGYGSTIHQAIYQFGKLESDDENNESGEFKYTFPIRNEESDEIILIIDEASLISSRKNSNSTFKFGTDVLLQDILTYARLHNTKNKIIFVGDPAQLPPVGDNKSWALESKLFASKEISFDEVELKEVLRQGDNAILQNATSFRKMIESPTESVLNLNYDNRSFVELSSSSIIEEYLKHNPQPSFQKSAIIAYSNAQCFHYNKAIRDHYYPNQKAVCVGDIIQIVHNNYGAFDECLHNGSFAKVVRVYNDSVTRTTNLKTTENNQVKEEKVSITYKKISLVLDHNSKEIECYIVDDLLNSPNRDLSLSELRATFVDFNIRFDEEQKDREAKGLTRYKRNSSEYKDALRTDKFLNAVRCKYGYAITCHKAQGGEWDKIFVDFTGKVSLKNEPLRWSYTAITRAINCCYTFNAPDFKRGLKFDFDAIGTISNVPNDALDFSEVQTSPFHVETQHKCKSLKYWDVLECMEDTTYKIIDLFTNDFLERYTIIQNNQTIKIEGMHNNAGIFKTGFKVVTPCSEETKLELETIFNQPPSINYRLKYLPSLPFLLSHYSTMQNLCSELGITITNVVEKTGQYYVSYYLRTDSLCSYIQFYFKEGGKFTKANPKSLNCENDEKLKNLIIKLNENAN